MANVLEVTTDSFQEEVLDSSMPVLVEFYTATCQFCKRFDPIIDSLADKYEEVVKFCRVDAAENRQLAMEYNIYGVPSTIIFRGGEPQERFSGLVPEAEVANRIDSVLQLKG